VIAAATHGPSALWYATRGSGATTLVLLSASLVFGIAEERMWRLVGTSRAAVASLHRTVSLLAVAFLAVHIITTVLDPFPPIGPATAVVPFATDYRPLWMGLGTLASDLLLAVTVTSLVRRRLGYRVWRIVHWLGYACWPVAIAHGLGTGSDTRSAWMLWLTLACVGAVTAALAGRLLASGTPPLARVNGFVALSACAIALAVWLPAGPLGAGWARRAGTPVSVLTAFSPRPAARPVVRDALSGPFVTPVAGRIRNGTSAGAGARAIVELTLRLRGEPRGVMTVRMDGAALADGGLQLERSAVAFGPPSDPRRYQGRIDALAGRRLQALVGLPAGPAIRLTLDLSLGRTTITGRLRATPVGRTVS
jgi:sulfoxide reductase heme-binding subunit YedZ